MKNIYVALIFIAVGILVKLFPNLIAGYSTLSQKEKENVKENGFPTFMMVGFFIMGTVIFAGHYIAIWLGKPSLNSNLGLFVTLIGAVVFVVAGQWFKR
jgi:NO-binding membrane sensor protein with MHYT domain